MPKQVKQINYLIFSNLMVCQKNQIVEFLHTLRVMTTSFTVIFKSTRRNTIFKWAIFQIAAYL